MKKKDLLIPVVMLAFGAGIGFWTRDRQQATALPTAPDAIGTSIGDTAATGGTERTAASTGNSVASREASPPRGDRTASAAPESAPLPLPPLDAKIADIYDTLKDRAHRGDGKAACRLAIELQQCSERDFMLQGADRATRMMANRPTEARADAQRQQWESRMLDYAQRQVDYAIALDDRCKGLSETQTAEHVDWWRTAALSGHVPSMVHYAKGDGFRLRATLDNLDRLSVYKDEAERLMRAAAAAGSAEALQQLQQSYADARGPRGTLLQQAIAPDPVEAAAVSALMGERNVPAPEIEAQRGRGREPPAAEPAALDAKQQAQSSERLAVLRSEWPRTEATTGAHLPPWEQVDADRRACDQDQFAGSR